MPGPKPSRWLLQEPQPLWWILPWAFPSKNYGDHNQITPWARLHPVLQPKWRLLQRLQPSERSKPRFKEGTDQKDLTKISGPNENSCNDKLSTSKSMVTQTFGKIKGSLYIRNPHARTLAVKMTAAPMMTPDLSLPLQELWWPKPTEEDLITKA